MIRKLFLFGAALMVAATMAFAQDEAKKPVKISGYLIDNMCAGEHADEAKEHKTSCSLMGGCARSGFSVAANDKTYKLDERGNKDALQVLKTTKTKEGVKVEVEGTLDGDTLHVDHLAEVY